MPEIHETVCPLDCPDACSLAVTVADGRISKIDGSPRNPDTAGFICAKVRGFGRRVYGDDRVLYPLKRCGRKGDATFARISWDEALDLVTTKLREARERWGAESILPYSYGGSNGLLTQDTTDQTLFTRLGASQLARTVCAAPTGAAAGALYGKMPGVAYEDYLRAKLIVAWGVNPSVTGIHLVPHIHRAQHEGALLVVIDPRTTPLGRRADLHLALRPGTDLVVALAVHRYLFEHGLADQAFLDVHATGWEKLRERATPWTFENAADVAGIARDDLARFAHLYARLSPAVIRCGWGQERNRNGGNATAAILALPAVAGKFGLRGGGYTMSNARAWTTEPLTTAPSGNGSSRPRLINMNHLGRVLNGSVSPPVNVLFVYNCNPLVTVPEQTRIQQGLSREDLFTIVFDQTMTDTARFADLVLPATTFLESYELTRGYGSMTMQVGRPVIERCGEARPNADVFAELSQRLDLAADGDPAHETDVLATLLGALPETSASTLRNGGVVFPPSGRTPVQFVDVFPRTVDGRIHLFPDHLDREAPLGLYGYQEDPETEDYPLALISPASDKTVSSMLGELDTSHVALLLHPLDAAARSLTEADRVRVFNLLGEVHCLVKISDRIRPGVVYLPKGLWRRRTLNGVVGTALVSDSSTDLGGGACFNDARVQVAKLPG